MVTNNEEIKNSEFMDHCRQWVRKDCSYGFDKDDKRSDCVAVVSVAVSDRSANGMFKKHCIPCGIKLIANLLKHKKDMHDKVEA